MAGTACHSTISILDGVLWHECVYVDLCPGPGVDVVFCFLGFFADTWLDSCTVEGEDGSLGQERCFEPLWGLCKLRKAMSILHNLGPSVAETRIGGSVFWTWCVHSCSCHGGTWLGWRWSLGPEKILEPPEGLHVNGVAHSNVGSSTRASWTWSSHGTRVDFQMLLQSKVLLCLSLTRWSQRL